MLRGAVGRAGRALALLCLVSLVACTMAGDPLYAPSTLRRALIERLPDVPPEEIVVPFEVPPAAVARARARLVGVRDPHARARALVDALSDPDAFGLAYLWAVNNSALRTLEGSGGNCLGLSSLLVGLARSVGLAAYYVDVSRNPEHREEDYVNVAAGHIAVVVVAPQGPLFVDFTGEIQRGYRHRRIGDLEAAAHYYNNRGYELIHRAQQAHSGVDWEDVWRQFARATRVAPDLATAWNNLGVASARLGRLDQAERSYQRAIDLDPALGSARQNLRNLAADAEREPRLTHADIPEQDSRQSAPIAPRVSSPPPGDPRPSGPLAAPEARPAVGGALTAP